MLISSLSAVLIFTLHPSSCWASQMAQWFKKKKPPVNVGNARDMSSTPGSGRSPGGGNCNLLQCSCLENSMDRAAWWITVHGVTENQTLLTD